MSEKCISYRTLKHQKIIKTIKRGLNKLSVDAKMHSLCYFMITPYIYVYIIYIYNTYILYILYIYIIYIQHTHISIQYNIYIYIYKLYGPFLWMVFNCLKATQPLWRDVDKMIIQQRLMFCSKFSFTIILLRLFPLCSKVFINNLKIYELLKINISIAKYCQTLVLTIIIYQVNSMSQLQLASELYPY